ncbi:hypothetical protein PaG_01516 [Moesziomyces aphidis]|uniref:Uncharacterized protein n=1 Tax=Moesziomyces aphidis TaxID=84754 RepID=W3VRV8_MOEAP|nr:hypothetical protein PaG_01516 [Moesziomyces aphidis]
MDGWMSTAMVVRGCGAPSIPALIPSGSTGADGIGAMLPSLIPQPASRIPHALGTQPARIDAPRSAPGNAHSKSGNAARRSSDAAAVAASVDPRSCVTALERTTVSDRIADCNYTSSGPSTSGSSAHGHAARLCTRKDCRSSHGTTIDLLRTMAMSSDAGHVDLLEWSQELDHFLLQLPFRPLRIAQSVVLYKLAYSTRHSQLGLLVLDCDTCAAYYEGVSLRTLERRSHLGSPPSSSSDPNPNARLADLAAAIHDALDATLSGLQATIELECTRFSCSVAIQAAAGSASSARQLKTSFDLDPLSHAAHATLLSTHLVRPLLSLAAAIAHAPSQDQVTSIASEHNRAIQRMISARSLKLIQATALAHAGKPSQLLQLQADGDEDDLVQDVDRPAASSKRIKNDPTAHHGLDGHHDMLFFGPPGFKPPRSPDGVHDHARASKHERDAPFSSDAQSHEDDGDVTLSATDIVRPTAAQRPRRQPSSSPSNAVVAAGSIPRIKTERPMEASDSDTSQEEESLPVKRPLLARASPAPPSSSDQAQLAAPITSERGDIDVNARETRTEEDQEILPPATPSASAFAPTPSQSVSPTRNAARDEQLRRRQQIANIKRGNEDPASAASDPAAQSTTTRLGAKQPQSSRKRSRF